jgi:hypothetical protein
MSNGLILPAVWDCAARVFMELVDGPRLFISEAMPTQIPPQRSVGAGRRDLATFDSSGLIMPGNSQDAHFTLLRRSQRIRVLMVVGRRRGKSVLTNTIGPQGLRNPGCG